MTTTAPVVEPGQLWRGQRTAHPWLVRVKQLSLNSVLFETVARGERGHSRVRGVHERQRMNRGKFLAQFRLEKET